MITAHTATPYQLTGDGLHLVGGNPQFLVADFDVNRDEDGNRARAKAAMFACNARDDLVKAAQDAYQQPWNPDSFGGYSEEQLALIRVGFNHAMNGVYAAVKPALAAAEPH